MLIMQQEVPNQLSTMEVIGEDVPIEPLLIKLSRRETGEIPSSYLLW
ncbi:MAG: hypothetical protein KKF93_03535 [Candidatus Omnitrophica bacterium]|nr:hypothetical protein [Candidatus Omnitrophota bacterium]